METKEESVRVENLKEVTVSVTAGTMPGESDLISDPMIFRFICGIGPGGLTPFEYELADRRAGETVAVQAREGGLDEMFGHLLSSLPRPLTSCQSPIGAGDVYLMVHIDDVKPASPREVVRAIAEIADCGDHCCGH